MSFLNKAKLALESGSKIVSNIVNGEELTVSAEVSEKRMSVCKGCPHFEPVLQRCNECGCMQKLKTRLAGMKCPLGKWEE